MKKLLILFLILFCFSCQSKIIVRDIETSRGIEIKEADLPAFLELSNRHVVITGPIMDAQIGDDTEME